jgi:HD-GYP domain-containing protein (c-di-GMP phosphodiesterase class II)
MNYNGIPVENLMPGMVLSESIYTEDAKQLLIKKGVTLSQELIQGLLKRKIEKVIIGKNDPAPAAGLAQQVAEAANQDTSFSFPKSLEERLFISYNGQRFLKLDDPSIQKAKKQAIESSHKLLQGISEANSVDHEEVYDTARDMLQAILQNRDAFINVAGIRAIDEYTFEHSVDVAAYTTIIAKESGTPYEGLLTICAGSLLHDAGKMLVDPAILNKPGKLTDEEFDVMKTHTVKGYDLLKQNGINEEAAVIALGHHERCDGKGYPKGMRAENAPMSSQMVAIADVYDALTSDRVYRKAMDLYSAMTIILSGNGTQFNSKLVGVFQHSLGIYPIGSSVHLNTGYTARVIQQNEGAVRPVIQLLRDNLDKELDDKEVVDLMGSKDLFITEAVKEETAA